MSGGFPGALGVVRIQIAPECFVALPPMPIGRARLTASTIVDQAAKDHGDGAGFIGIDSDGSIDCWVRARQILSVEVVPTEDPGLAS